MEELADDYNYTSDGLFDYPINETEVVTESNDTDYLYCGEGMKNFRNSYKDIHGYSSLVVCMFGSIANVLNIIVLSRKEMRNPTNSILTGLAVADMMVMLEYIPFIFHMHILKNRAVADKYSYGWAVFVLFHANFTQICHTISIWLTIGLAVWRYMAVGSRAQRGQCTSFRATLVIVSAYIFSPILCIPVYLTFDIRPRELTQGNGTVYVLGYSHMAEWNQNLLPDVNFWIYSVVVKLIPCFVLCIISFRLIRTLSEAKKRKKKLTQVPLTQQPPTTSKRGTVKKRNPADRQANRTTKMLVAVLMLFLITEIPQGILALFSGILGKRFFESCYQHMAEVMDFLALVNSAINFILYCSMSSQFRRSFSMLFHTKPVQRLLAPPQNERATSPLINNGNTQITAL